MCFDTGMADYDWIGSDHEFICPVMPLYQFVGGVQVELHGKKTMNGGSSRIHTFGAVATTPVYICAVGSGFRILWEGPRL